ncbi:MAG: DUF1553 domain-containing protein [Rhodothermales bacterium]
MAGCGVEKPAAIAEAEANLPETVDFNLHVKPILSDRCFACHGPDAAARAADLRLDTPEGAYSALKQGSGKAIVPGHLGRSEVWTRLVSDDPDVRMPPPESNLSMTPEEIALIGRWIDQGAEYKPHWSTIPPEQAKRPDVDDAEWPTNTIDYFVLDELERRGWSPSNAASKETLIRRVTFDLTGLPPTVAEIDAFLADDSPDAYERVVDRLLESDAHAERMATEWLDVARYADTHGYQDDGLRTMWPWRDWVIQAFKDNLPYDDFVTWQLAGDMLPDATKEQILASGFNRNHMQSQEGGIVLEEYRLQYVADRTHTFGKAFLGVTMECAQCHDHKYDPISQKEYYQLFAFFNNAYELGNIPYTGEASPTLILTDEEVDAQIAAIHEQIDGMGSALDINAARYDAPFEAWLKLANATLDLDVGLVGDYPLDTLVLDDSDDLYRFTNMAGDEGQGYYWGDVDKLPTVRDGVHGRALQVNGDGWLDMGEGKTRYAFDRHEPFSVSFWFKTLVPGIEAPLMTKSAGLFNGRRGYRLDLWEDGTFTASLNHVQPANALVLATTDTIRTGQWQHVVFAYDGSSSPEGLTVYLDGQPMNTVVKADGLTQSIRHARNPYGDLNNWGDEGNLRLGFGGNNEPTIDSTLFDALKVYNRRLSQLEVDALRGATDTLNALRALPNHTPQQTAALREHYVTVVDPDYRAALAEITELRGEENTIMTKQPSVMVMKELPEPRETHILDRGAYDAPTERVEPGTPESFGGVFPDELPPNRLGLAQWLFQPGHPITSRVVVNRYWQLIFGRGIVGTSDDFGNQGSLPTHPRLLDYLAVDFERDWDVRGLLKQMVLSSTYRQTSYAEPEQLERDPENEWLARGPSFRLTAEMIRDNALATSGLLVREVGGPSVKPYQPAGLWKEQATRNATEYVQDTGDKLYRRSMYTIWKRSTPPPSMMNFDASERNFCITQRQRTSTPLQALVLMNDPQYIEAARMLAERMVHEGGSDLDARLTFGFRTLTSRYPSDSELEELRTLYTTETEHFDDHSGEALELLAVGEYPRDTSLPADEVAALAVVASTVMNFDEAVVRR